MELSCSKKITKLGLYIEFQQPQLELQGSSSAPKVNVYNYNEQQGSSSAPKLNVYNYNDQQGSSSAPKVSVYSYNVCCHHNRKYSVNVSLICSNQTKETSAEMKVTNLLE